MKFLACIAAMTALLFAAATLPAAAQAPDPAVATVQHFYDVLLESMKGGKTLGAQGRYAKLKPEIEQDFDSTTMIKFAVGPDWASLPAGDQKALTDAFSRMTAAQYAGNFDSFNGEKFVVDPAVIVRGTDHYVSSKLVTKDQSVTFIYRLRQFGSQWKIIDVLLEGSISQISVYRSDYSATMKSGGASALVAKINAVSDKALK